MTIQALRWTARVLALLIAAGLVAIFVGHAVADGVGPLLEMPLRDVLLSVALLAAWAGLLAGWRWERLGGALVVLGIGAFYVIYACFSGGLLRGCAFPLIALPGVLYLICWRLGTRTEGP